MLFTTNCQRNVNSFYLKDCRKEIENSNIFHRISIEFKNILKFFFDVRDFDVRDMYVYIYTYIFFPFFINLKTIEVHSIKFFFKTNVELTVFV